MNSETVYKMAQELQAAKLHDAKEEVVPETETNAEVQPEEVGTNDTTPDNDNVSDDTTVQETVVESGKDTKPVKPSKADQKDYAFAKLKNKERQKREKMMAEYEEKIKHLNAELEKFKGLSKDSFKSDEEYVDYLVNRKMTEQEANQLKMAQASVEAEHYDEINQARIAHCFPDEADRESYQKMVDANGQKFVELLSQADPENAVLSYLDDSDLSPLLIRVMMTKPEYRNEILGKKSPYGKTLALDDLAKRLAYAKSVVDKKRANAATTKPKMPVVGKVAKTETQTTIDKNDPNYWHLKLRELNQARGR